MRTEIDLTDEGDDLETASLSDEGDMLMRFGDVAIRMTYSQFFGWLERINAEMASIPDDPAPSKEEK